VVPAGETGGFFDPTRTDYRLSLLTNVAVPVTDLLASLS